MTNHRAAKFVAILGCSVLLASCGGSSEPQSKSLPKRSTTSSSTTTTTTTQSPMVSGVAYSVARAWLDKSGTAIPGLRAALAEWDSKFAYASTQASAYRAADCVIDSGWKIGTYGFDGKLVSRYLVPIQELADAAPWVDLAGALSAAVVAVNGMNGAVCGGNEWEPINRSLYNSLRATAEANIVAADSLLAQYANAASVTTTTLSTTTTTAPIIVDRPSAAARMPNVLCMSLQQAQNAIQGAGVFYSRSVDATGQGRSQFNDSNWQVVAQDPAPGVLIGEGTARLSAVKYGEPSPC